MPTEFTHLFVSGWLGRIWAGRFKPARFWLLAAGCSILPDIDVIGYYFGVKYTDLLGHRGFSHSLVFALLAGVLVTVLAFPSVSRFSKQWFGLAAFFVLVTASNGLLDSMTDKGMGVGFFMPFDDSRYVMQWRPLTAWPLRMTKLFSPAGLRILLSEFLWIWLPLLTISAGVALYRRKQKA